MTQEEAETTAKSAYTIFRGADVSDDTPAHWDDLTVAQRAPLIFVAQFAGQKQTPALGIEVELRRRWKQYRDNSLSNEFSNVEQVAFGGRAGGLLEAINLIEAIPLSDAKLSIPTTL